MRYVLDIMVLLMVVAIPALVLVTLIVVLSPFVFGDSIPQRDQDSGQDGHIVYSHADGRGDREIWAPENFVPKSTVGE